MAPKGKDKGCTFKRCPPSNDRWNPWPFMRRFWDAVMHMKTEYVTFKRENEGKQDTSPLGSLKQCPLGSVANYLGYADVCTF